MESTAGSLNAEQQKKYDQVIGACPEGANRENYQIIWITKMNSEN